MPYTSRAQSSLRDFAPVALGVCDCALVFGSFSKKNGRGQGAGATTSRDPTSREAVRGGLGSGCGVARRGPWSFELALLRAGNPLVRFGPRHRR